MKENDYNKISVDEAVKLLAKEGLHVSREQATIILNFLYKLADIAMDIYLTKENDF